MDSPNSFFNLAEVIDACAAHAWETREAELKRRGIETEAQLRREIERTVFDSRTKACQAHLEQKPTDKVPTQVFMREIYDLRPYTESDKKYGITVILNPTRNPETGKVYGGTCYIRERPQFESLRRQERDVTGTTPELVIGGRPALLEREQRRQIVEREKTPERKQDPQLERETYLDRQKRLAKQRGDREIMFEIERKLERSRKPDDPRYG